MIKIGIIGATGYAGVELIRILLNHPQAELAAVSSVSFEGKAVSEVYPSLYGLCDLPCCSAQEAIEKSDVIFACVQHGISQEFAAQCAEKDVAFIDLGADFRLKEESDYAQWYGGAFLRRLHRYIRSSKNYLSFLRISYVRPNTLPYMSVNLRYSEIRDNALCRMRSCGPYRRPLSNDVQLSGRWG